MASLATWLIIVGFVLLITGIVLRTVIMMGSSDASESKRSRLARTRAAFAVAKISSEERCAADDAPAVDQRYHLFGCWTLC
jgi:uncharacterized membrane protein